MQAPHGVPSVQDFPSIYPVQEQLRFLLRYAILAPSTRNTQPWRFSVDENRVVVRADDSRAQPIADDDRREMFLSVGCAIENLLVAAEHFGFRHEVEYRASPGDPVVATVSFTRGGHRSREREGLTLQSISDRRTVHGSFPARPVSDDDVAALCRCVGEDDLALTLTGDREQRDEVERLHLQAHEISLADPAFRHELAEWVGAGGLGTSWPLSRLGQMALDSETLAHQFARFDAAAIRSSPLLLLISSRQDDRISQVRSGQLLQRIWLAATTRGLGLQPLSAALEVPQLRSDLSATMDARLPWAQQLVRIGWPGGGRSHHEPSRRRLDEMLDPPEIAR